VGHATSYKEAGRDVALAVPKRVWTAIATAISLGHAFCYNGDIALDERGATEAVTAAGSGRHRVVEAPSIANIADFAGFAAHNYPARTGGQWIEINVPQVGQTLTVNAQVSTTCQTTIMGVIPLAHTVRAGCLFPETGFALLALQTVNRATVAGEVQCRVIPADSPLVEKSTMRYFNDFLTAMGPYVHAAVGEFCATENNGAWHVTLVGSPTTETIVIADDGLGGILVLTTDGTNGDTINCAMNGSMWKMAVGTPLFFEARVAVNTVAVHNWFIGLTDSATDAYADPSTDAVGFRMDHDSLIDYLSEESGSQTTASTAVVPVGSAYNKVAFLWDGIDTLSFFVDDVFIASIDLTDDDICDDVALTPTIVIDAGDAAAVLSVDYLDVRNAITPR